MAHDTERDTDHDSDRDKLALRRPRTSPQPKAPETAAARRSRLRQWQFEATAFVHELLAAADAIAEFRGAGGPPVLRTDPALRLLLAIEQSVGCPAISDVARRLKISRQSAAEQVHRAAAAGRLKLLRNRSDRRILQVELTALARQELRAARGDQALWILTLLNGLDVRELRRVAHILYTLRRRIARYASQRRPERR